MRRLPIFADIAPQRVGVTTVWFGSFDGLATSRLSELLPDGRRLIPNRLIRCVPVCGFFRAADWHPFSRPAAREPCILGPTLQYASCSRVQEAIGYAWYVPNGGGPRRSRRFRPGCGPVSADQVKVVFENDRVRVLHFNEPGHSKLPMHSHPAYVTVGFTSDHSKYMF